MLPWLAIRLIDFFFESRTSHIEPKAFYDKNGLFGGVKWDGLGAFFAGIVVSSPFMAGGIYEGPLARMLGGADISYFVSFIVTGIVYSFIRSDKGITEFKKASGVGQ